MSEEVKNDDLVVKLIDLRERVSGIQSKAMEKDVHIDMTIKMAFEKVEWIVTLLRASCKNVCVWPYFSTLN